MQKTSRKTPKAASRPPIPVPEEMYAATPLPDIVRVPERTVLALEGAGPPEQGAFQRSIGAIYAVAYGLKFAQKAKGHDFRIGPIEARWWSDAPPAAIGEAPPRETWRWELRMGVPDGIAERDVAAVVQALAARQRGNAEVASAARSVRVVVLAPQTLGRVLHIGPYADEPRSLAKARDALCDAGLQPKGPHIEVYLNDPRRTASARLRTVLLVEPVR